MIVEGPPAAPGGEAPQPQSAFPPPPPAPREPRPVAPRGWSVRERPERALEPWDLPAAEPPPGPVPPVVPPTAPAAPGAPAAAAAGSPAIDAASPQSEFPTNRQLLATLVAAVLVVAGTGAYLWHSRAAAPLPAAPVVAAVAVVHSGPAVLTAESLNGGGAGHALSLPGEPDQLVTTADGATAFLLDTNHGEVIPVNLARGTVGSPIAAGKLPVDEHLSPDGATLYVTDNLGGAVIPIDTATGVARPAHALVQGIDLFVPSPTGRSAVVSVYGGSGQPGVIAFDDGATGLGRPLIVGDNTPAEVFYSHDGTTVWVTEAGVGNRPGVVIPVDVGSHAVGAPIAVGHSPGESVMTPDGQMLVVTNRIDRTVSLVDLTARRVVATVPVGSGPSSVQLSTDGATAWVACALDRSLVPVNLATHAAGTPVALSNSPAAMTPPNAAASAWVLFPSSAGSVTFVKGTNDALDGAIAVGNVPSLAIGHDSRAAWVINQLSDTVQRVDIAGNSAGPPIEVARTPQQMKLTADGRTLLVLSFGDGVHPGSLTAVDTTSTKAGPALAVGVAPSDLVVAPDSATAYIANHQANAITTVDLRTWQVGATIALPCSPSQLVITPGGTTLYAGCSATSQVVPITTSGDAVGAPIMVGPNPAMVMGNKGRLLFIKASQELQEIDVTTNKVVVSHPETANIVTIMPTPSDATLVAVDNSGAALLLVDTGDLVTTRSVAVGVRPDVVQLAPDGSTAYVLDTSQQKLYVVGVAAAVVSSTIDVSPNATSVAVPAGRP